MECGCHIATRLSVPLGERLHRWNECALIIETLWEDALRLTGKCHAALNEEIIKAKEWRVTLERRNSSEVLLIA